MNPMTAEQLVLNLEREIENMELRILESVWSLERAVLDQMEILKSFRADLKWIKSQLDLQQIQLLDHQCLHGKSKPSDDEYPLLGKC
jgi:hypothetical protein